MLSTRCLLFLCAEESSKQRGQGKHHETTFRKHNEDVQKLVGISKSAATYAKYDRCMRRLEEFMQARYRIKDIALKEISHVFITDFETYLRTECRCNENTTAKFMQTFRMIIIMAKNNGWI